MLLLAFAGGFSRLFRLAEKDHSYAGLLVYVGGLALVGIYLSSAFLTSAIIEYIKMNKLKAEVTRSIDRLQDKSPRGVITLVIDPDGVNEEWRKMKDERK